MARSKSATVGAPFRVKPATATSLELELYKGMCKSTGLVPLKANDSLLRCIKSQELSDDELRAALMHPCDSVLLPLLRAYKGDLFRDYDLCRLAWLHAYLHATQRGEAWNPAYDLLSKSHMWSQAFNGMCYWEEKPDPTQPNADGIISEELAIEPLKRWLLEVDGLDRFARQEELLRFRSVPVRMMVLWSGPLSDRAVEIISKDNSYGPKTIALSQYAAAHPLLTPDQRDGIMRRAVANKTSRWRLEWDRPPSGRVEMAAQRQVLQLLGEAAKRDADWARPLVQALVDLAPDLVAPAIDKLPWKVRELLDPAQIAALLSTADEETRLRIIASLG